MGTGRNVPVPVPTIAVVDDFAEKSVVVGAMGDGGAKDLDDLPDPGDLPGSGSSGPFLLRGDLSGDLPAGDTEVVKPFFSFFFGSLLAAGDTEVVKPFFSLFFGSLLEDCSSRRLSRRLRRDGDVVTLVLPRDLEGVTSAESFGLCPPSSSSRSRLARPDPLLRLSRSLSRSLLRLLLLPLAPLPPLLLLAPLPPLPLSTEERLRFRGCSSSST